MLALLPKSNFFLKAQLNCPSLHINPPHLFFIRMTFFAYEEYYSTFHRLTFSTLVLIMFLSLLLNFEQLESILPFIPLCPYMFGLGSWNSRHSLNINWIGMNWNKSNHWKDDYIKLSVPYLLAVTIMLHLQKLNLFMKPSIVSFFVS